MFYVQILGSSSAIPAYGRLPNSQILVHNEHLILIDCGEGTQTQLLRYKYNLNKIEIILISHLHGDHILGLVGLINTMNLLSRSSPLNIYGPTGIREFILNQLRLTFSTITAFELSIHELDYKKWEEFECETKHLIITLLPLKHRIPCIGFRIQEKPKKRKFLVHQAYAFDVPKTYFKFIKAGNDYTDAEGNLFPADLFLGEAEPSWQYAYCSDTAYNPELIPLISGRPTVLFHEATFLHNLLKNAEETGHTTAWQAAKLAAAAEVDQLIIGHFSARYKDSGLLLKEAQEIFPSTISALEGLIIPIPPDNNAKN